jgi:hypothetical protein
VTGLRCDADLLIFVRCPARKILDKFICFLHKMQNSDAYTLAAWSINPTMSNANKASQSFPRFSRNYPSCALALAALFVLAHWPAPLMAGLPEPWRYDGNYPTAANLRAIWAAGENDGDGGVILHWDGVSWETMETPTQYDIYGIHGTGPSDIWAVGGYSLHQDIDKRCLILHFDGNEWTEMTPPDYLGWTYSLSSVHAVAPDDVWATTTSGPTPVHWDGSNWEFYHIPLFVEGSLYSITSVAPDHLFITGSHGQIMHKQGDSWTMEQQTESGNFSVNLIQTFWASDIDHVFAGDNFGGLYRRESDGSWTDLGFGGGMFGGESIRALWGQSGSEIYMLGDNGYRFWDGTSASPERISFKGQIRGAWINADGAGDLLYCIGDNGVVHEIQLAEDHSGIVSPLATGGGQTLGDPGVPLRIEGATPYGDSGFIVFGSNLWRPEESPLYIFDGQHYRPFPFPSRPEQMSAEPIITSIIARGPGDILMSWHNFLTFGQGLHRWNGAEWIAITTEFGFGVGDVEKMWESANGDVFAISPYRIYRIPNGSNSIEILYTLPDDLLSTVYFTAIWGRSNSEIYIGTGDGRIYRFNGATINQETTPATDQEIQFICGRGNDVYALGGEHMAWKRESGGWQVMADVEGAGGDPFTGVTAGQDGVYATQATNSGFIGGGTGIVWKFVGTEATIVAQGISGAPGHIVRTHDGFFYALSGGEYVLTNRPIPDHFSAQRVDLAAPGWQVIGDSGVSIKAGESMPARPMLTAWQSDLNLEEFPFGLPEGHAWTLSGQQWNIRQDVFLGGTALPPVFVQFEFDPDRIPAGLGMDAGSASLLRTEDGEWQAIPAVIDNMNHTIATASPTSLSSWTFGAQEGSNGPAPLLTIEPADQGKIRLSWPTESSEGFSLYSATAAGSDVTWSPVQELPVAAGDVWELLIEPGTAPSFYRLQRP